MRIETPSFVITGKLVKHIKKDGIEIKALCTDFSRGTYAFVREEGPGILLYHCYTKEAFDKVLNYEGGVKAAKKEINKIKSQFYIKKLNKYRPEANKAIRKFINSEANLPIVVWAGLKEDD